MPGSPGCVTVDFKHDVLCIHNMHEICTSPRLPSFSHFSYKPFGPMYITSMLQWTVCDGAVGFHASDCVNYRRQYALKT